jgi:glycosyltransferase involved in cell wall biosynthesis
MSNYSEPLVSILTPVYNTEAYLPECIESILAQSYDNWEYIIVNNRSTDRTLEIAQEYRKNDNRIRIHNNKIKLDVIQNHNSAFRQISSKSKYCKVVHADDWIFPDCISRMVGVAEDNPSVAIIGSYRLEEQRVTLDGLPFPSTVVSGREVCRLHLLGDNRYYVFGSPTSLLYRSDIIRSHKDFYGGSNVHADKEACFSVLKNHDFGFVHQVLTYTRRHNETESSFSKRFNTFIIGDFTILLKYGPVFLNEQEYEEAFHQLHKTYYSILGRTFARSKLLKAYHKILGRSLTEYGHKEFLEYHKKELGKLGHPISLPKLYKSALIYLYNRLLDRIKIY